MQYIDKWFSIQKPIDLSQKNPSNKKATKSLLQKIALLIPSFFMFVARSFYSIGLKLSCALDLIGSSLIYLFQKVFSGKNRKQIQIYTSKTEKTLEQSNIRVDSRKKERKEELDRTELIEVLNRRKENDPEKRDPSLKGKAFEMWLLRNYGEFIKEVGLGERADHVSIPKAIESLEESGKDVGDERFDLVAKLEKKIRLNFYMFFGDDPKQVAPFVKDAELLTAILENEKNDLTYARLALAILEGPLQDYELDIAAFVILLSFLKRFREAGKTEEQIKEALKEVEKEDTFVLREVAYPGKMEAFCKAVEEKMDASLLK